MSENKGRDNQTHTSGYSVEEILDEAKRMKKGERPVMGMNKPSHTQTWHTDVLTKDEIMATRPLRPDQFSKPHDILDETSAPGKSDAFLRASKAGPMVHVGDRKGQTINPRALTAEELLGDAAPEREKTKIERTKERLERLLGGYDEKPAKPQKEQGAVFSGKSSGKASSAATENNSEPAVKKNEKPALRTERSALKAEKTDIPRIEPKPLSELLSDSGRDTDAGKKPVRRFFGTKGGAGGANNMSAQRIQTPPGKSENKEPERPDPTPAPSVTQAKEETKNVTGDKAPTSEKKKYGEAKPRPQGKSVSGSKDQKQDVIYRAPGLRSKSFSEITEAPKKTTSEKEKTVFEELNKPMKPDSQEKRGGLFSRIFQKGKEPGTQSKQPKQPESEELPNLFSPEKSEMKKRLPEMNSENSGIGSLGLHPTTSTDGNGKDHTREILAEELRNIPVSPVHFWRFAPGTKIGEAEKSGGDAKEKTAEPVPEEKQGIDLASETKTEEIFGRPPEEATENGAEQTGKFASSLKTPEPKSQTEEKPRSAAENAKTEPAVEEISSVSEIPVPETPARENAPVFSETPESSPEKKPLEDKKRAVKEEPETFFLDAPLPEEEPKPKRKKRSRFGGKRRTKEEPEEFFLDEPLPEEEPE
ncbi:MAG TPA: hypothetical protein DEQ02_05605, partial [Ruminococcaceae bacterium]|nr:hypothetical protein [Oscillospiraceae bacterium]